MIRFTVVWHPEAQDELASVWLDAADRQSVTLAANAIDRHLATDTTAKGIQVEGDLRQLTVPASSCDFRGKHRAVGPPAKSVLPHRHGNPHPVGRWTCEKSRF